MQTVEVHLDESDLVRIELARIKGEQSPEWDTMSGALAMDLARVIARR